MADQWFIVRDEKRYGPYTSAQMKQFAASGKLLPIDIVSETGAEPWVPASQIKSLFPVNEAGQQPAPPEAKTTSAPWYYSRDGEKHGPLTAAQLKQLAQTGELRPTDSVWKDGMPTWKPASEVKGLFDAPRLAQPKAKSAVPPLSPSTAGGDVGALAGNDSSGKARTGKTKPGLSPKAKYLLIGAGVGVPLLLIGLTVVLLVGKSSPTAQKPGGGAQGKQGDNGGGGLDGIGNGGEADFSKVDYTKGPNGEKLTEQTVTTPAFGKGISADPQYQFVNAQVLWTFRGFGGKGTGHPNVTGMVLHGKSFTFIRGTKGPGANSKGEAILSEEWYFNGKKHGTYKGWHAITGRKKSEGVHVQDRKEGKWQEWYDDGSPKLEEVWSGGKRHGPYKELHANGQKRLEGEYTEDRKAGKWREWYENGSPKLEEVFSSGQKHGPTIEWDENGGKQEWMYADSKLNGLHKTWYPGGARKSEQLYKDDKRQGFFQYWDESGRPVFQVAVEEAGPRLKDGSPPIDWRKLKKEQFADLLIGTGNVEGSALQSEVFVFHCRRPASVKNNPFVTLFGPPAAGYREPTSWADVSALKQQWTYNCSDGSVVVEVDVKAIRSNDGRMVEDYAVTVYKVQIR